MAAFFNLLGKSKPAILTSFYRRAPNTAGGLFCGVWMTCPTHLHERCPFIQSMAIGIIFYLYVRTLTSEPIFIIALRTGSDDWQELLTKIGIPGDSARTYARTFVKESITKDSLTMIDREVLKELGVTTMGHALAILKLAKEQT